MSLTRISGSATTYCFRSLSPNARETARTPPTLQVPEYVISPIMIHYIFFKLNREN